MPTLRSKDGTVIAFERIGQGPPILLVDGALCSRAFGPMPKLAAALAPHFTVYTYDRRGRNESTDTAPWSPAREVEDIAALIQEAGGIAAVFGVSSGAALALEAARTGTPMSHLVIYEAPFLVDDSEKPMGEQYLPQLKALVAENRRGEAVKHFLRRVGVPRLMLALMPLMPMWRKLKAVAPTLVYDISLVQPFQVGRPYPDRQWAGLTVPTLVLDGGKSPAWMRNGMRALADGIPGAQYRTLPGQTHMVKAPAVTPVVTAFVSASPAARDARSMISGSLARTS